MFNYRYNISRRNVIVHAFFDAYLMLYSSLMPVGQYFLESHTKAFVKKKLFFFFYPFKGRYNDNNNNKKNYSYDSCVLLCCNTIKP